MKLLKYLMTWMTTCVSAKEFGWAYDEADLYRADAPGFAEYTRFKAGTRIPKNWMRDAKFRLSQYNDNRGGGKFQSGRRN